ncbi:zinc finger protein 57-like [Ostrinia nubilalis]|uniref:zinc finger protein 57-like n=1 Tax=Ostrinia nubilalis TaxID=29057 RepID=UPI00308258AD
MHERSQSEGYKRTLFKCEKCVKGFNFEDVLQTHMEKHSMENGSLQCDICTQYCPSVVSLRGHMKSHTTRYKCKLCGCVRQSRQHLLEHHNTTHTRGAPDYTCRHCGFTTAKRTSMQRHVKSHRAGERHACHQCGKLFKSLETLRVHTMRHDKSKRLQCEECGRVFIYPSLLHRHVQAVHVRKDYYCVECDVEFKSRENLRLHFKKAKRHRDASSYQYECGQCPERFVSPSTLSTHVTMAHGQLKQHSCPVCRRLYSSRDALRAHTRDKHSIDNIHCGICDKSFSRKTILAAHMRTHGACDSYEDKDKKLEDSMLIEEPQPALLES